MVVGKTKKTFFRKSKDFELHIYYTTVKNKIMIINIEGVELNNPNLGIELKVGDSVDIVYDWIDKWGGVERVLVHLHTLFPHAHFFTSVADYSKANWAASLVFKTSFLQLLHPQLLLLNGHLL